MKKLVLPLVLIAASVAVLFYMVLTPSKEEKKINVIFDTDMGNDIDDALALDMLYKYVDEGRINLLGIVSSKEQDESAQYVDILNNFYGYPDIPLGKISNGVKYPRPFTYTKYVCDDPSYPRSGKQYKESTALLRELLASAEDGSVVIIAVGFFTNLSRLMATEPDELSSLSGMELIKAKVKTLVIMGGDFEENPASEHNIVYDTPASQDMFNNWPTVITTSPAIVGWEVRYPCQSILEDFLWCEKHPMVEAYKVYKPMPYDRPMWDPSTVLYAIEPEGNYFTVVGPGDINVTDDGKTVFSANERGRHFYLSSTAEQKEAQLARYKELITRKPKNHTK